MAGDKHPTERLGRNPNLQDSEVVTPIPQTAESPAMDTPAEPTPSSNKASKLKAIPKSAISWFYGLNRNAKLALSLGFLLVLIGSVTLILSNNGDKSEFAAEEETSTLETTEAIPARITRQDGTLELKNEESEWSDTTVDTEITEGDSLRTIGATSRSIVTFKDGSELRLDANSEVELLTVTEERVVIRHVSGYTYNRVSKDSNTTYVVESTDARYEALGTLFRTAVSGDEQSVEVYESSIVETSTNKTAKEGEKLIVENRARPSESDTIVKLDIEALKQDAFIKWNRDIDLANDAYKNNLGFLKDFDAPDVTISTPAENEVILLEPTAAEGTVEITGKTERGATLTVQSRSSASSQPVSVTVGDNGDFTTPVLTAPIGNSVFVFVVRDRAGNSTEKSVRYTFLKKSTPVETGQVSLTAEKKGDKVSLKWELSGDLKAPDGYRIVYGTSANPTIGNPTDVAIPKAQSAEIDLTDLESSKTYYFRVCIFNAATETCSNYSNQKDIKT